MTESQETYEPEIVDSPAEVPAVQDPNQLLAYAIGKNASIETLEKLMALQERHEANEARKAYHKAMSAFKADPPEILKTKAVIFGQGKASYKHATLDHIAGAVGKSLSEHGLSASWSTEQNSKIKVTCTITHELGHSESTSLEADADTSGSKNAIQAIGSAITYLQRYTLLALTGLAAKDQDDDGTAAGAQTITEKQAQELMDLASTVKADEKRFLAFFGIKQYSDMPAKRFGEAKTMLNAKRKPSNA